jgi:hypothetical protein
MARSYPIYLSVGTTKYGYTGVVQYNSGFEYGLNYPPPTPINLTVEGGPSIVDGTPTFGWTNPTFSWEVPYGDGDAILYELQISFNDPTFATLDADTNEFSSADLTYTLAPEYTLGKEGTYYSRIRSTDGYTYSSWSASLKFVLFLFGAYPPTIDPVTSPAGGFWQTITGTKGSGLYVFVRNNGGVWSEASYPDDLVGTTWSFNVGLTNGTNYIEVIAALTSHTEGATSIPVPATIYLIVSTPEVYNIWNCFDEFGLILGLPRIPGEKNYDYKQRLLDVYTNPANSTYIGLRNGISRELGLTPSGIIIERLSDLMDPNYPNNLLNIDENALGTKLVDYADEVYDHNPVFFGNIICDESYWDGVDETTNGYNFLPHMWDPTASGVYGKWQAGGVGDNDDLWVNDLVEIWNPSINGYSWFLPIHTGYFYSAYPSGVLGA